LSLFFPYHIPPALDRGYKGEAFASQVKQMLHRRNLPIYNIFPLPSLRTLLQTKDVLHFPRLAREEHNNNY